MKPSSKLPRETAVLACIKVVTCGLAASLLLERLTAAGAEPPRQEALVHHVPTPEELKASSQRLQQSNRQRTPVYKSRITPHWFKDFEFLVVPGIGHSNGGAHGVRRMKGFFVRHLHGVEPPDRNAVAAAQREPIIYTVKFPEPAKHYSLVEMRVPAGGNESIELMMAEWSPGFYRVEHYASRLQELSARTPDGKTIQRRPFSEFATLSESPPNLTL
jgi:hypothetical protein